MANSKFDLVSPNIKNFIKNRIKYLKTKRQLEINRHSVGIELVNFNMSKSDCIRKKNKEKKRCLRCLKDAYEWGVVNYQDPITKDYIEELGKIVDPIMNPHGFRDGSLRISGARCRPPSREKLDRELQIYLWENESLEDPLEKAVHSHFNIARIHPFEDGNGRTSRLIQDIILIDNDLPVPSITLPERSEYIQFLEEAAYDYNQKAGNLPAEFFYDQQNLRDLASQKNISQDLEIQGKNLARKFMIARMESSQKSFYEFIGLKELDSLSNEINRLYPSEGEMKKYLKKRR